MAKKLRIVIDNKKEKINKTVFLLKKPTSITEELCKILLDKIKMYDPDNKNRDELQQYYNKHFIKSRSHSITSTRFPTLQNLKVSYSPIGKGSTGKVYKGTFIDKNGATIECAVKVFSGVDKDKNFLKELRILESIEDHRNIVHVFGIQVNLPAIVLEIYDSNLSSILYSKLNNLNNISKIRILKGIVNGMYHLHTKKIETNNNNNNNNEDNNHSVILHRDLKAENVLIKKNGEKEIVSICDFGLSEFYNPNNTLPAGGTIIYLAPEAICLEGNTLTGLTLKSDVFSFSILGIYLFEEKLPYNDIIKSDPQVLKKIKYENLRPTFSDKTPPQLQMLFKQCYHQNPEERPSFDQIRIILKDIIVNEVDDSFN